MGYKNMSSENMYGNKKENLQLLKHMKDAGVPVNKYNSKDSLELLEAKLSLSFQKLKQISHKNKKGIQ